MRTDSELHYTVWLAFNQACAGQPPGDCANGPIARMWEAWQKRRLSPIHSYTAGTGKTYPLLSMWPSCASPLFTAHAQEFPRMWSLMFACVRRYRSASVLLRGELQLRPEVERSVREPLGGGLGLLQHLGLL